MPRPMRTLTPEASPRHFVGALLREWRIRLGWSQSALGKRVGASASWISRIEKAERSAPADLLSQCDQVLGTGGLLTRYSALADQTSLNEMASAYAATEVSGLLASELGVDRPQNDSALRSNPAAGLSAAAAEAATSATRLFKLAEGLRGAVQRARLDGLNDQEIADHLAVLRAPIAVRAALAADGDGTAMRFLIASLAAAPDRMSDHEHRPSGRMTHTIERG
jgi:transcriptional regulator with XRE-family HTH domain